TPDVTKKTQLGGIAEYKFKGTPFSASADVRWVRTSRNSVDDIVPKISGGFDQANYSMSADYTFKNDVDGENDYSAEIDFNTHAGILIVGVGKHSTVTIGFLHVF